MSIFKRALCAVKDKRSVRNNRFHQHPKSPSVPELDTTGYTIGGGWPCGVPVFGEGDLTMDECLRLERVLTEYDDRLGEQLKKAGKGGSIPPLSKNDVALVVQLYNHMLASYDSAEWCERDNHGQQGTGFTLIPGQQVPNYYANIHSQSIHRRKVLSLAGLRNLVIYGPEIYKELQAKLFSSDPSLYRHDQGVHKMRYFTGNAVDLDTTVLRATDGVTLKIVNMMNLKSGLREFASSEEFGNSQQAAEIARVSTKELLDRFAKEHCLTKSESRKRRVDLSDLSKSIPIARSNSDRGKHPLWRYVNAGQDSFHCNVPCVDDVVGALLRAPIRAAKVYLRLLLTHKEETLNEKIADFLEYCIVDACFNQKWRAVEEYDKAIEKEGSIVGILQRLQQENQIKLMEVMDDDDEEYTLEKSVMWSCVEGNLGRDSSGTFRRISQEDVDLWVSNPEVVI